MRYFLIGFALVVVAIISMAGFRGSTSHRTPIESMPDMVRQLKLRPQAVSEFFPDRMSSRLPVPGTVAVGTPYQEIPFHTGFQIGTTNWVDVLPVPVTPRFLVRGQQRYDIYCAVCHGATGDGNGITRKFGMGVVANLHDERIVRQPDGELFHVITHGRNLMGAYGGAIPIEDRWAIVAYLRALHRSHLGLPEDVPPDQQAALPPRAAPPQPAPANAAPDDPTQN
jgi:mono/diheme cytochrome c family protein